MFLTSISDIIQVVTAAAVATIGVQSSWIDHDSSTYTPGRTNKNISTNTTTTIVDSPAASTTRHVRGIVISNNHATSSCQVTVQHYDGSTSADIASVNLLAGEQLERDQWGFWRHLTAFGADYEYDVPARVSTGITGTLAETVERQNCEEANLAALSTGQLVLQAIWLRKGQVVTNISFFSATTAANGPTNWFFALYSRRYALLAQSANQTTAAWAANTIKTLAMGTAYTVPETGFYYIGVMMTASTAVVTLKGRAGVTANQVRTSNFPLNGSSTGSLTTALPDPCAAPTGSTSIIWAAVS